MTDLARGASGLDWIVEAEADYVMGVPTHAMDVLAEMRRRDITSLGNVKTFYMAGSAIPRDIAQRFMSLGITPQNVYGMTENGSHNYTRPSDTADTIVSTCGRPWEGYEIKLWKQDNIDVEAEPGEIGEIGGRGAVLMLGYFNNQAATESSFNRDGWFMSGDLGVLAETGCLQIVGRKKDLIIRAVATTSFRRLSKNLQCVTPMSTVPPHFPSSMSDSVKNSVSRSSRNRELSSVLNQCSTI